MARIYENEKGFKIIEVHANEMVANGCGCICDNCEEPYFGIGYYVAVLNRWFCPTCFKEWYEFAENCTAPGNADGQVEDKNFNLFKTLLNI